MKSVQDHSNGFNYFISKKIGKNMVYNYFCNELLLGILIMTF